MNKLSISTDERRQRYAEQVLQCLQGQIMSHYEWLERIARELKTLCDKKPITKRESFEREQGIAFKNRQLNELRKALNVLEAKARTIAQELGITN